MTIVEGDHSADKEFCEERCRDCNKVLGYVTCCTSGTIAEGHSIVCEECFDKRHPAKTEGVSP